MNILTMLWKNLLGRLRTLLFPERPKVTQRFRGLMHFDPELCTGCAICKFRCTSRAINFKAAKASSLGATTQANARSAAAVLRGMQGMHTRSPRSRHPADLSQRG